MIKIGIRKAQKQMDWLLDQVTAGREVIITRWGKPVARLEKFEKSELTLAGEKVT